MAGERSQTAAINAAAALIGSTKRIADIDEASSLASSAKAIWDRTVDAVLSEQPWKPAVRREWLNRLSETPAFGWAYQYQLPADCLRWLPFAKDDPNYFQGEQEGNLILTDHEGPLPVRLIWRNIDLATWSPGMYEALIRQLAEDLAEPVTALAGVANRAEAKAERAMRGARRQNGLATGNRDLGQQAQSSWLAARNRG
ncbi:MAG: hypothetical protein KAY22_06615 [Rhizorhabdus sp.]|uniref:hypothetical protein n=1 Tax=Rhizorhabdus sp. TaxID=1968843 RepID=UPI001B43D07A|nr:hypothetical protein [Rhizorhabdus sp.]MBP8231961.1 hypothetical protein [Rhizorhabdus sp.]